jgi:hypothetical protein
MKNTITFGGMKYTLWGTRETQLTRTYGVDWAGFHSVRESVQNQLDEVVVTGCGYGSRFDAKTGTLTLRDDGRGVSFEKIMFLGATDKRDQPNVVGQHGEGEVLSTLAAVRAGITKIMASQDWLMMGRFTTISTASSNESYEILTLDVYKSDSCRQGTMWQFSGPEVAGAWVAVQKTFANHAAHKPNRARVAIPANGQSDGQLFSRGMLVNDRVWGLALSYDLDSTPGRDRAGFTWEAVAAECEKLFQHITVKQSAVVLTNMLHNGAWTKEAAFRQSCFSEEMVKAAARICLRERGTARGKKLVWTMQHGSVATNAEEQGHAVIVLDRSSAPAWLVNNLPHAETVVKAEIAPIRKPMPRKLAEAVQALAGIFYGKIDSLAAQHLNDTVACANFSANEIVIDSRAMREQKADFDRFVEVVIHECSHLSSMGSEDCSVHFERHLAINGSKLARRLATDEDARMAYQKAEIAFETWVLG